VILGLLRIGNQAALPDPTQPDQAWAHFVLDKAMWVFLDNGLQLVQRLLLVVYLGAYQRRLISISRGLPVLYAPGE
jgi:hypothetical protein